MKSIKNKCKRMLVIALTATLVGTGFYTTDISAHAEEPVATPVVETPCHHEEGSCVDWYGTSMTATEDEVYQAALQKAYNESITYSGMTDLQKARAFHDYLAQHVEYDYTFSNYDGYGALVEGTAVCQGYTYAYADLLDMAGIENAFALSYEMNHIWNFVKIDGKWYHVDVTWDDPSVDKVGYVRHANFLVSDDKITANEHYGWFTTGASETITCTSTTYDSAWWQNGTSAIFCIDGKEYYLDKSAGETGVKLMCRTGNTVKNLYTKNTRWNLWGESYSFWTTNFASLSYFNGKLYFNDTTKLYSITPGGTTPTTVYTYTDGLGYVYGSLVCDATMYIPIWQTPSDGTDPFVMDLPGFTKEAGTITNAGYDTVYTYSGVAIAEPTTEDFTTNAGAMTFTWYQDGIKLSGAPIDASSYTLNVKAAATSTTTAAEEDFDITIKKKPISITSKAATIMYGESELPGTTNATRFDITGLLDFHMAGAVAYTINPLTAGTSTVTISNVGLQNTATYANVTDNYEITYVPGTVTIEKRPITVTAAAQTIMYGDAIDATKATLTSGTLAYEDQIEIAVATEDTEPTEKGVLAIASVKITNKDGQDVTSSYDITKEAGTLTIVPPHEHTYTAWDVTEATCTSEGQKERSCTTCTFKEIIVIPKLGHDYTHVIHMPTCTEEGYTTHTCSRGDHAYIDGIEPKLGHSFTSYVSDKNATCQKDGTMTAKCNRCDETDTIVDEGSKTIHKAVSTWTTKKEATCTAVGSKYQACVFACGAELNVTEIPVLGHSFTVYVSNGDATCLEDGTMTAKCDRCSATDTVVESNSIKDHSWGKGVVDKEQGIIEYTCQFGCGKTKVEPWVSDEVVRVYGGNRFKTSLAIADELKEELNVEQFETIIVASGLNFPDALAGSYLSAKTDAPILMVNADTVTLVQSYIEANLVDGGTVYLLGGTGAVPATIEENLKALRKYEVQRLSGKGRYDTNLAILNEAGVTDETILVCTGTNFADSLSGSATGLPILMVDPVANKLTDKQIAFLENIDSDIKVIGGTGAVSDAYMEALERFDKDNTVERIKGASRYNTSVEVAQEFFPAPHTVVIASATSFPDGLCGGPLAYAKGCPLILTGKTFEPASAFTAYNNISNGIALGGTGALSDAIVRNVFGLGDQPSEKNPLLVYEDKYVKVEYVGVDEEWSVLLFSITNKTNEPIGASVDAIVVNGVTEMPIFGTDILPKTKDVLWCDVSDYKNINKLNATLSVYDSDGYEIEEIYINDVLLNSIVNKQYGSSNNVQTNGQTKKVYEDSHVKVEYMGIDANEPALILKVSNISDQPFSFSVDSIVVGDKTEHPVWSISVLPNSYAKYVCDVSSVKNMDTLTATMCIYDMEGSEIEEFFVSNVSLK